MSKFYYRSERVAKKKPHEWFGGGGSFKFFISEKVWNLGFSFLSLQNMISPLEKDFDENVFLFLNASKSVGHAEAFKRSMHQITLPPLFIESTTIYRQLHGKKPEFLEIIKEKYHF